MLILPKEFLSMKYAFNHIWTLETSGLNFSINIGAYWELLKHLMGLLYTYLLNYLTVYILIDSYMNHSRFVTILVLGNNFTK